MTMASKKNVTKKAKKRAVKVAPLDAKFFDKLANLIHNPKTDRFLPLCDVGDTVRESLRRLDDLSDEQEIIRDILGNIPNENDSVDPGDYTDHDACYKDRSVKVAAEFRRIARLLR